MESRPVTVLLMLYAGVTLLNLTITGLLWRKSRAQLYLDLFLYWSWLLLCFMIQGAASANPSEMAILLSYAVSFPGILIQVDILAKTAKTKLPYKQYSLIFAASLALMLVGAGLKLPFYAKAIPLDFGLSLPMLHGPWAILRKLKDRATFSQRGMALVNFVFFAHLNDFAFLRLVPAAAGPGFTVMIFLVTAFAIFSLAGVNEVLAAETEQLKIAHEHLGRDLEVIGVVQNMLLPKMTSVQRRDVALEAYFRPAQKASGDWWWHDQLSDGRHLILVGDVTGHGLGPAMITAVISSAYESMKKFIQPLSIEAIFEWLQESLSRVAEGTYAMTMSIVEVDPNKKQISWTSAGAPPICIQRSDKTEVWAQRPSSPLGTGNFTPYLDRAQLEGGERIFVFTDGIYEFPIAGGRQYGLKNLVKVFEDTRGMALTNASGKISAEIQRVHGEKPLADDMTFVLIDYPRL